MNKNKRLYECDECHRRAYFHWVQFTRAAKPKCPGCGCSRLEPVSNTAKVEIVAREQVRAAHGTRSMHGVADISGNRVP